MLTPRIAAACTPAPGFPREVRLDAVRAANILSEAATFIDIAVVIALEGDPEIAERGEAETLAVTPPERQGEVREWFAEWRRDLAPDVARGTYKVEERLKGSSPETFALNGVRASFFGIEEHQAGGPPSMQQLKTMLDQTDLADVHGPGSCWTPILQLVGKRYLVFRDADGTLLRADVPYRLRGRDGTMAGPVHVHISDPDDEWPVLVRRALRMKAA